MAALPDAAARRRPEALDAPAAVSRSQLLTVAAAAARPDARDSAEQARRRSEPVARPVAAELAAELLEPAVWAGVPLISEPAAVLSASAAQLLALAGPRSPSLPAARASFR